jgi:hypothetical protein
MFFFTSPKTKHPAKPTKTKTPLHVFFFSQVPKTNCSAKPTKTKMVFYKSQNQTPRKTNKNKNTFLSKMTTQTTEHGMACLLRRLLLLLKQEKQSPLSQQYSSSALSPPSTLGGPLINKKTPKGALKSALFITGSASPTILNP